MTWLTSKVIARYEINLYLSSDKINGSFKRFHFDEQTPMIQQVTRGIKISVVTNFQGTFYKNYKVHFAFSYRIHIENQSKDAVQLNSRFWQIKDSLGQSEIIQGEGVIGQKPVIKPGESHSYSSGCLLNSSFGAMKGHYNMVNFTTTRRFKVHVPTFKLSAPYALN